MADLEQEHWRGVWNKMKIEKLANTAGYVLGMVGDKWGMLVHRFGEKNLK